MPPKKAAKDAPVASALPIVEDEVHVPEAVGLVADPPFAFAIAHVAAPPFAVEAPAEDGGEVPVLRTIDPCQLIAARAKATPLPEDPLTRTVVVIDREELKALSESEASAAGSLAKAFLLKARRESDARRMRKVNAARRNAIAAAEAGGHGDEALAAAHASPHGAGDLDFMLQVLDYPATAEELQEVRAAGVLELSGSWVSAFLSATTVLEEPGYDASSPEAGAAPPKRQHCAVDAPPALGALYDAVHSSDVGSPLARCTVCTVRDTERLLPARAAEVTPEEHAIAMGAALSEAALAAVRGEVLKRQRFAAWLQGVQPLRIEIPQLDRSRQLDTRVYDRLASSVDIVRHDVPVLLHCLCEQVAATLDADKRDAPGGGGGGPDAKGADANSEELKRLEAFLDGAHDRLLLGDLPGDYLAGGESEPSGAGAAAAAPPFSGARGDGDVDDFLVLPYLDTAGLKHIGDFFPGRAPVIDEVRRVLSHVQMPGLCRRGFQATAPRTAAQRSALRNRFYVSMPLYPVAEIDRMLLLRDFERLMQSAQPERKWCFRDRVFHEHVPAALLPQVLLEAARDDYFMDTFYDDRCDQLLIALHRRVLPGRTVWHEWRGDLLAGAGRCSEPTFNDWWQLLSGDAPCQDGEPTGRAPDPPSRFFVADAREMGYCRVVEKAVQPSDGSTLLATSLRRGLSETFPRPAGGVAAEFVPRPRREVRIARAIQDGMSFGIFTDDVWLEQAAELRKEREARDRQRAAAAAAAEAAAKAREDAAALRRAQGLEEDPAAAQVEPSPDEIGPPPELVPKLPTERRLEELRMGRMWAAFPDGARCSVRIQHERRWYAEGSTLYDETLTRPGALFTYSPSTGFVMQVFSDGALRLSWPQQLRRQAAAAQRATTSIPQRPGGAGDIEVTRIVTPLGVVARNLTSGRREVWHPDGTCAFRNPTADELRECAEVARAAGQMAELEFFEQLARSCDEQRAARQGLRRMPANAKAAGLPGHWVVARPDGKVVGRAPLSPSELSDFVVGAEGDDGDGEAADAGAETADGAAGRPDAACLAARPASRLATFLGGEVAETEGIVEYDIDPTPVAAHVDPHTGQSVAIHGDGLMVIEDLDTGSRLAVMPDGSRVTRTVLSGRGGAFGHEIRLEHPRLPTVVCSVRERPGDGGGGAPAPPRASLRVECGDGTTLEATPQRVDPAAGLAPVDPAAIAVRAAGGSPPSGVGNASALLQRPDGAMVFSRGDGCIDLVPAALAARLGAAEALRAARETPGAYTAFLVGDMVHMRDDEGNEVEMRGDQTVGCKLAALKGQDCPSPRCLEASRAYGRPDAAMAGVPAPSRAPPPRLLVVRGDAGGDAEELLPPAATLEALRADPDAVRTEIVGRCRHHTILRTLPVDPAGARPSSQLRFPPSVAGLPEDDGPEHGSASTFERVQQIVEYPPISQQEKQAFLEACLRFDAREEAHRKEHETYGEGFRRAAGTALEGGRKDGLGQATALPAAPPSGFAEGGA